MTKLHFWLVGGTPRIREVKRMRLIDADSLKHSFDGYVGYEETIEDIDNAPTVPAILISVIEQIKAEIQKEKDETIKLLGFTLGFDKIAAYDKCLGIIDRHIKEV